MSWMRKKGKYWYFVESRNGKEIQYYIGDDKQVKRKLLPNTYGVRSWEKHPLSSGASAAAGSSGKNVRCLRK